MGGAAGAGGGDTGEGLDGGSGAGGMDGGDLSGYAMPHAHQPVSPPGMEVSAFSVLHLGSP
jgi:hypothetical protein